MNFLTYLLDKLCKIRSGLFLFLVLFVENTRRHPVIMNGSDSGHCVENNTQQRTSWSIFRGQKQSPILVRYIGYSLLVFGFIFMSPIKWKWQWKNVRNNWRIAHLSIFNKSIHQVFWFQGMLHNTRQGFYFLLIRTKIQINFLSYTWSKQRVMFPSRIACVGYLCLAVGWNLTDRGLQN